MASFNAILERERQRTVLQQSIMPENRTALLAALHNAGIVRLEVNYDGYGDSGQINEQNATLATGETAALETYHSGYENNEGGNGAFAFDIEAGTIELIHNDVVTDYETSTHAL